MQDTSQSPGNAGSRGSDGQANRGAGPAEDTNRRALPEAAPDTRDADARGGGGAASASSRSQDPARPDNDDDGAQQR